MTTPNNQPTPPDGMRLLTPEEYGKPLPEICWMFSDHSNKWIELCPIELRDTNKAHEFIFYAVPITPAVPATGGTTNEKGGEPCAESSQTSNEGNIPSLTPASNAPAAVQSLSVGQDNLCPYCSVLRTNQITHGVRVPICEHDYITYFSL